MHHQQQAALRYIIPHKSSQCAAGGDVMSSATLLWKLSSDVQLLQYELVCQNDVHACHASSEQSVKFCNSWFAFSDTSAADSKACNCCNSCFLS